MVSPVDGTAHGLRTGWRFTLLFQRGENMGK
jgi:hypothetical protein